MGTSQQALLGRHEALVEHMHGPLVLSRPSVLASLRRRKLFPTANQGGRATGRHLCTRASHRSVFEEVCPIFPATAASLSNLRTLDLQLDDMMMDLGSAADTLCRPDQSAHGSCDASPL